MRPAAQALRCRNTRGRRRFLTGLAGAGINGCLAAACEGVPGLSDIYDYEVRMLAKVQGRVLEAASTFQVAATWGAFSTEGEYWSIKFTSCPPVLSIETGDLVALTDPVRQLPYPTSYGSLRFLPLLIPLASSPDFRLRYDLISDGDHHKIYSQAAKLLAETRRMGRIAIPEPLYPQFAWIPDRNELATCVLADRAHLPAATGGLISRVVIETMPSNRPPQTGLPSQAPWVNQAMQVVGPSNLLPPGLVVCGKSGV